MSDLSVGGTDEDGIGLGEYTTQMKQLGIDVLDAAGNLRDVGDVIEEIGGKWNTYSRNQQQALAQAIAGTRQYSRMVSLFDNWDMYESALATSKGSAGALQKQQDIYMESLSAKMTQLKAAQEDLYLSLLDSDSFKTLVDLFTKLVEMVGQFVDALGGGGNILLMLIPLLTKLTSGQIASGTTNLIKNITNARQESSLLKAQLENLEKDNSFEGLSEDAKAFEQSVIEAKKQLIQLKQAGNIDSETFNQEWDRLDEATSKFYKGRLNKDKIVKTEQKFNKNIAASFFNQDSDALQQLKDAIAKASSISFQGSLDNLPKEAINERISSLNLDQIRTDLLKQNDEEFDTLDIYKEIYEKQKEEVLKSIQETETSIQQTSDISLKKSFEERLEAYQKQQQEYSEELTKIDEKSSERESFTAFLKGDIDDIFDDIVSIAQNRKEDLVFEAQGIVEDVSKELKSKKFVGSIEDGINLVSDLALGFAGLRTVITTIPSIWNNEDLTTGEKVFQIVTNIVTAMGTLVPLINTIKNTEFAQSIIKAVNTALVAKQAKDQKDIADNEVVETKEDAKQAVLKKVGNGKSPFQDKKGNWHDGVTGKFIKAPTGEVTETAKTKATETALKSTSKSPGALKTAGTAIKAGGKAAIKGIGAGAKAVGSAALKGAAALGPVGWAAILGVAAITTATILIVKAYNKEKDALEDAKKAQEALNKAVERANTNYQKLTSAVDNYTAAQKKVAELTKGTQEWSQALLEANNQVLELLKTYPELQNFVTNENGQLKISELGLEAVEKKAQEELINAQNAQIGGQRLVREAQIDYDATKLERKIGVFISEKQTRAIAEDEDALAAMANGQDALAKYLTDNQDKFGEDLSEYADNIIDNSTAMLALKASIDTNNRLIVQENSSIATNLLRAQGYDDEEASVLGGIIGSDSAGYQEEFAKIKANIRKKEGNNQDLVQRWAKNVLGLELSDADVKKSGGSTFKYKDADGNWQKVSYDVLADEYAQYLMQSEMTKDSKVEEAKAIYNSLKTSVESSGGSKNSITALNKMLSSNSGLNRNDLQNLNKADMAALEEAAKQVVGSVQEEYITNTAKMFQKAYFDELANVSAEGDGVFFEQVDYATKQLYSGLKASFETVGAGEDFTTYANQIVEKFGEDVFDNIDWHSSTVFADLTNLTNGTVKLSTELITGIKALNGTLIDTPETIKNLNDVLDGLTGFNSEVSAEDYSLLLEQSGGEASNYFTRMADGTYRMTSTLEEFTIAMDESRSSTKEATRELLKANIDGVKDFKESLTTKINDAIKEESIYTSEEIDAAVLQAKNDALDDFTFDEDSVIKFLNKRYDDDTSKRLRAGIVQYLDTEEWNRIKKETGKDPSDDWIKSAFSRYSTSQLQDALKWTGGDSFTAGTKRGIDYSTVKSAAVEQAGAAKREELTAANAKHNVVDKAKLLTLVNTANKYGLLTETEYSTWYGLAVGTEEVPGSKLQEFQELINSKDLTDTQYQQIATSITNELTAAVGVDNWAKELASIQETYGNDIMAKLKEKGLLSYDEAGNITTGKEAAKLNQWEADKAEVSALQEQVELQKNLKELGVKKAIQDKADAGYYQDIINTYLPRIKDGTLEVADAQEFVSLLLEEQEEALDNITKIFEEQIKYLKAKNSLYSEQLDLLEDIGDINNQLTVKKNQTSVLEAQVQTYKIEYEKLAAMSLNTDAQKEAYLSAVESYTGSLTELATQYTEEYELKVEAIFETFTKNIEKYKEQYDLAQEYDDTILSDIDRTFGIQSLETDFNSAIAATSSLAAQNKLNAAKEEELDILKNKDKLTQYDLDRAKLRLQITQAEIALEEAQTNKSKMRLVRGANGQYGYQFVADEDEIAQKKQELADLNQELINLDESAYKSNLDKIYELLEEFKEKVLELDPLDTDGIERLTEGYSEILKPLLELTDSSKDNLISSVKDANLNIENLGKSFEVASSLEGSLNTMVNDLGGIAKDIQTERETYQKSLEKTQSTLNEIIEDASTKIGDLTTPIDNLNEQVLDAVQQLTTLNKLLTSQEEFSYKYIDSKGKEQTGTTTNILEAIGKSVGSYDTGGYTGEWGSGGKLLMAHEKELILNPVDTENLLKALDFSNTALQMMNGLSKLTPSSPIAAYTSDKPGMIEQQVHIEANFPNVSVKSEIEEAFNEIVNMAVQRAYER